MRPAAAPGPDARRTGRIRRIGIAVLVALSSVIWLEAPVTAPLKAAWFDAYQGAAPRTPASQPVTIVEIDQRSLAAIGQWPWPRTVMAELVDKIRSAQPAAIALDILMPEADALSPERLLARAEPGDTALAEALSGRPTNDAVLARALAAANVVLVVAGTPEPTGMALRAPPFTVRDARGGGASGTAAPPKVAHYPGALTSIDALDSAASGRGLISVDPEGGIIRRIPLAASIDGTLVPALAIEIIRAALHEPSVRLHVAGSRVEGISVGDFAVPTEADGAVRIYYSRRSAQRFVSAVDVLEDKVDPARLAQKLVLIGVTGLGLLEYQNTPVGERMPGSEIHAQLLENLYDGTLLRRPDWAPRLETAVFLLFGGWLVVATPRWKPRNAALLMAAGVVLPAGIAFIAFRAQRTLFDAATPAVGLMLLFGVLLVLTLTEATRQKKALERVVQAQREEAARVAGELEAARRIQTATLPRADLLAGDARIDVAATMIPARETGGDLYDYFRLDERSPLLPRRRRGRQGTLGQHLHGGQQGAVQERDAARAGRRHRAPHVGRQRRSLARQRGNAVRHRVRRDSRPRDRAAPVLQRGAREPVPDPRVRRGRAPHRGRRRPAALRALRLRLSRRAGRAAAGRASMRGDRRRDRGPQSGRRAVRQRARRGAPSPGWAAAMRAHAMSWRRCVPTSRPSSPVPSPRTTSRSSRCAGTAPAPPGDAARSAHDDSARVVGRRRQRTMMSTRRLRGSATPSAVGTNNSRFPRPTARMFSGAIPLLISPARMTSARWRDSASLY